MGQARRDLAMARQARDTGFFEWACFISQQALLKWP
jgi:HEPN domain-containing protein